MVLFDLPLSFVLVSLFLLGTVLGSFLNVCIYRIPNRDEFWPSLRGLWNPGSRCPRCLQHIRWYDNIPIISWIVLRGRCRNCSVRISPRYLFVELLNGLLFVALYWVEVPGHWFATIQDSGLYTAMGPTGFNDSSLLSPVAILHWRYFYHMVLIESLVVATFIDIDFKIIPDPVTLPAMAVGIIGGLAIGQVYLVPVWFQDTHLVRSLQSILPDWLVIEQFAHAPNVPQWFQDYPHIHGLLVSVVGLIVGGGVVWAVRIIGQWVLRQEAMGFGDVILMATIGSFLGWQPTLVVFFLAPVCALIVVAASWIFWPRREIPYGPYLSVATLVLLLGWKHIWPVADRIFSLGPFVPVMACVMAVLLALSLVVVQGVKRLLGVELYPPEWIEEWTSADQLHHFDGERTDSQQGQWHTPQWPGKLTGRGSYYYDSWRNGGKR